MENNINPTPVVEPQQSTVGASNTNLLSNKEIKCGNCGYIGPGEKNRSLIAVILAWLCIIIAPIITLIYFIATHTWKCPNCKSTFVGVKNKNGVYAGQLGGEVRWVLIIFFVIIGIAIAGILSSVVLASLNVARTKGADATIKAGMANLRVQSMLYEDKMGTFKGFCNDSGSTEVLKKISIAGASNEYSYVCNDSEKNWAISNPLRSKGYWCIDSSENEPQIMGVQLINQVSCSISNSTTTVNKNLTTMRDLLKDEFVNGCASGSTPKTYCICVFDKMEEGLGLDGLLDAFKKFDETGIMDERTINLIKPCSN